MGGGRAEFTSPALPSAPWPWSGEPGQAMHGRLMQWYSGTKEEVQGPLPVPATRQRPNTGALGAALALPCTAYTA